MSIAYQYNSSGYYVGEIEDYGLLPNNATYMVPVIRYGFIPHWTGATWEQVENHVGESGWVNGIPFTIKDYGPYPDGWSTEPPAPTPAENVSRFNQEINSRLLSFAQEHDWDTIEIALVQTGAFSGDAKIAQSVYDATWTAAIPLTAQIEAGTITVEDALALLPPMSWTVTPTELSERDDHTYKWYRPWGSDANGNPEAGILIMIDTARTNADPNDTVLVNGLQAQYDAALEEMQAELDAIQKKYHPTDGGV